MSEDEPKSGQAPAGARREQLVQTFRQFVEAKSPAEAKQVLVQHRELMGAEAQDVIAALMASQDRLEAMQRLLAYSDLLNRASEEGIDAAFADLMQAAPRARAPQSSMAIPAEFEPDIQKLNRLAERAQSDPASLHEKMALVQDMLGRLRPGQADAFRAGLLTDLGNSYQALPEGDRLANLQQAIGYYRQALRFRTREQTPFDYARTQMNLGGAYASLPGDDQDRNLRQAIDCFREALTVYTPETAPVEYARTQYNLGTVLRDLSGGERTRNLEEAIACFQEALAVLSRDTAPQEYADTLVKLGESLLELPRAEEAPVLQKAIDCFEEALTVLTPETDRAGYAMARAYLARAYATLPSGDRAASLEKATTSLRESFSILSPEGFSVDFARMLAELGFEWRELTSGDRAHNLQQAIACFRQALAVLSVEVSPDDFAAIQTGLGVSYRSLPIGDRAENLQQAIACYYEALKVYTHAAAPLDYARTQSNLGNAYALLPTGDAEENLKRSIACFREALTIFTPDIEPLEYAKVQVNLGESYRDIDDLPKAIDCFREALKVFTPQAAPLEYAQAQVDLGNVYLGMAEPARRWLPSEAPGAPGGPVGLPADDPAQALAQAITCYQAALTVFTPETTPWLYATAQNDLGEAYRALPAGDRSANLAQAIACYREALRIRTAEASPDEHRTTASNLGKLHFAEKHWAEAHDAYASALAAGEALYRAAGTEVARQVELREAARLFPNDAYSLARLGRFEEAVERLEAGRARALAEALARNRVALERAQPEDRTAFLSARARIAALEIKARALPPPGGDEDSARAFTALSSDLREARGELDVVIHRIRAYLPEFLPAALDFKSIAAAALPGCPLVYLTTTSQGGLALIVPPGAERLDAQCAVWADDLRLDDLMALLATQGSGGGLEGYLMAQVDGNVPRLQAALDRSLPVLEQRLMAPLATRLAQGGSQEAVLIPTDFLGLLPLHAAAFERMSFIHAPSARSLQAAANTARERAGKAPVLLGIGNPLPSRRPLPFARAEVEAIAPLFGPEAQRLLCETEATRTHTLEKLPGATHLHFSCHGRFDVMEPLDSALYLSGSDTLTLRDLLDGELDLSASCLAVLSACQTGITDIGRAINEAVGFPAGFLQAGVPGVVGTLWSVPDISTALLLTRFYRYHLAEGLDAAAALHQAQRWLRDSSAAELGIRGWYERQFQASGQKDRVALQAMQYYQGNPDVKPFAHPYFWAAFVFSGVGQDRARKADRPGP